MGALLVGAACLRAAHTQHSGTYRDGGLSLGYEHLKAVGYWHSFIL
jgi:hypothetical protein